jgi:nucleotide-binding universal stress UspA family protein
LSQIKALAVRAGHLPRHLSNQERGHVHAHSVPTDGSEFSEQAVNYGVALAKSTNAKLTGITVTAPFHIFVVEPDIITDTPESYKTRMSTAAAKRLAYVKDAAAKPV